MAALDDTMMAMELKNKNSELSLDNDNGGLKEFERLDSLLAKIPKKAQFGILKTCDLVLTCMDANSKYIALGTNVGLTFLYSRKDASMQRLKATNTTDVITSVKLHDGVDDLVATGTAAGRLTIFCIPGIISVQKKQIQKFDVQDIHRHYITCLVWSTNGMKLYSGDKNGIVGHTDIDFYQGVSKSSVEVIEPSTEITQLDYLQRVLLVSTRHRSFVVRLDKGSHLQQIGTKERKIPGLFGACFIPGLSKPEDAKLYAARPGCRVWLADVSGTVKTTHIFGDPLSDGVPEIPLLAAGRLQLQSDNFQLGRLLWLHENALVSWSSSVLVVLDPVTNRCVARQSRLSGIADVVVVPDTAEIYLLRRHGDARVIRISYSPEVKSKVDIVPVVTKAESADSSIVGVGQSTTSTTNHHEQKEDSSLLSLSIFKKLNEKKDEMFAKLSKDPSTRSSTETHKLPPVVDAALSGLDISQVSKAGEDIQMPQIKMASETESSVVIHETPQSENVSTGESAGGIVFSHRMKKAKKKKTKEALHHPRDSEADRVSEKSDELVTSVLSESLSSGSDESTMKALKEADDILSIFQDLIHRDSKPIQNALPETTKDLDLTQECDPNIKERNHQQSKAVDMSKVSFESQDIVDGVPAHKSNTEKVDKDDGVTVVQSDENKNLSQRTMKNADVSAHVKTHYDEPFETSSGQSKSIGVISKHLQHGENVKFGLHDLDKQTRPDQPAPVKIVDTVKDSKVTASPLIADVFQVSKVSLKDALTNLEESSNSSTQSVGANSYSDSEVDQHMNVAMNSKAAPTVIRKTALARTNSEAVNFALARVSETKDEEEHNQLSKAKAINLSLDVYSEIKTIEASNPFGVKKQRGSMSDDFYSYYMDPHSLSPDDDSGTFLSQLNAGISAEGKERSNTNDTVPLRSETATSSDTTTSTGGQLASRTANAWTEFKVPANIYSLAVSDSHVWFTDKSENIYYSALRADKGIVWRKATGNASQISVSPSGFIVWRLHRGVVHAGTKICQRHPEGMKWVEAVRDVEYISVYDNCAWYIKRSGEVMVQHGLSKERPCYRSRTVDCGPYRLKQVTCGGCGVVWAVTEQLQLIVRLGVTHDLPHGETWEVCARESPPYLFSHVAIDNENIGWAVDISGQVWFCLGVTLQTPMGKGEWYQLPMSGYIMQEETTLDMIRSVARKFDPSKLSHILSVKRGGLITSGSQGVWLAMDRLNQLQVCRGNLQGYQWVDAAPGHLYPETYWKHICASSKHASCGLVWAQSLTCDLFTFKNAGDEATCIPDSEDLACISVAPNAVWALSVEGDVRIRTGMSPKCPLGDGWTTLDLSQLRDAQLVHLSCNANFVWAVDLDGVVYHRIGVGPPTDSNLSPVWLALDTISDIVFTKVFVGPVDWMVWAMDNRRLFYVRVGITDNLPIGREWIHVPGLQAVDMAMTHSGTWALTTHGEIYHRYGITQDRPVGDYWKRIPGSMAKISASGNDELWGISLEGELMQCQYHILRRRHNSADSDALSPRPQKSDNVTVTEGWELMSHTLTRQASIADEWELV